MLTPSEVAAAQTYARIDPDAIANYLVAHEWRFVHEEDGNRIGIRWFRHACAPRWGNVELITNRSIPFALSHVRGAGPVGTIVGGGTLLRVGAKRYPDYAQMNADVLSDLEVHEDRWIGLIIADIVRDQRPPDVRPPSFARLESALRTGAAAR